MRGQQAEQPAPTVMLIDTKSIVDLHDMALRADGGMPGMRDAGAFESAVAKIENLMCYDCPDLCSCAAALAYGLAKNHPFNDANKRTAYLAMDSFLRINGMRIVADVDEQVEQMVALAASQVSQEDMGRWIASHAQPVAPNPQLRLSAFRQQRAMEEGESERASMAAKAH